MVLTSVALVAGVAACGGEDEGGQERVRGSGAATTVTRDLDAFDRIELAGEGDVRFGTGVDGRIEIDTDDNLVGRIETTVADGTLTIRTERGVDIDPSDGITYRLGCPAIVEAELSGAGSIDLTGCTATDRLVLVLGGAGTVRARDLDVTTLLTSLGGAGRMTVAGEAARLEADLAGAAEFDAADLRVVSAEIDATGVGTATVWVIDDLDLELAGVGSFAYYGEPDVTSSVTGLGSVEALGPKGSG